MSRPPSWCQLFVPCSFVFSIREYGTVRGQQVVQLEGVDVCLQQGRTGNSVQVGVGSDVAGTGVGVFVAGTGVDGTGVGGTGVGGTGVGIAVGGIGVGVSAGANVVVGSTIGACELGSMSCEVERGVGNEGAVFVTVGLIAVSVATIEVATTSAVCVTLEATVGVCSGFEVLAMIGVPVNVGTRVIERISAGVFSGVGVNIQFISLSSFLI